MSFAPDIAGGHVTPRSGRAGGDAWLRPLITGPKRLKYNLLTALWFAAALFFWTWWLTPAHNIGGAAYWVVTAGLGWLYFLQVFFILVFRRAKVPGAAIPAPGTQRVAMIVTKTPSEPFAILRETLQAMLAQDYPADIWIADEDPQPETVAWCAAHGVRISSRKGVAAYHQPVWPRRTRCKEGNLAYFYDHFGYENYDIVAQFDADHVPTPNYLSEIMRGFADPGVGYVSAPSICSRNADESWAARARLHNEAAFHGIMQAGYTGSMTPMCIGSHYAVRTQALREAGGLGPDLAEDHSTTMLIAAKGWRGVHALDAIAHGDGPATIADMCIQEFQWSRSLFTLLLRHTPAYLRDLPPRLRFQFLFCQTLYPMFALMMTLLYLVPVAALTFDLRYADVTYPAFLGHSIPTVIAITLIAFALRRDGHFRPFDGKVLSWEKALFLALQWPWVFWGCVMALRDRITGGFVDFRITPKGEAADTRLPLRIVMPYAALALGSILPVLLISDLNEASGFYLLALFNAAIYAAALVAIVFGHFIENDIRPLRALRVGAPHIATALACCGLLFGSAWLRGTESVYALTVGLEPLRIVSVQYHVAGAGMSAPGKMHLYFDPGWNSPAR